jgi:hypothetical protein
MEAEPFVFRESHESVKESRTAERAARTARTAAIQFLLRDLCALRPDIDGI